MATGKQQSQQSQQPKQPKQQQKGSNQRNIYEIPSGYYLNFQAAGKVYRECFSNSVYGGKPKALSAAVALRDLLELCKDLIAAAVKNIESSPETEPATLAELRQLVRGRLRKGRGR